MPGGDQATGPALVPWMRPSKDPGAINAEPLGYRGGTAAEFYDVGCGVHASCMRLSHRPCQRSLSSARRFPHRGG